MFSSESVAVFLVFSLFSCTLAESDVSSFMESLTNTSKYDRRLRPLYNGGPVNVTVGLTIASFAEVSEVNSDFTLDLFLRQVWSDPRLRHGEPRHHTLTGTDKHLIWLPDTFILNVKEAYHHHVPSDNSQVAIEADGDVMYSIGMRATAGCEMDLSSYPLDTQTCQLRIMSYAHVSAELVYKWGEEGRVGMSILNTDMAEFEVTNMERLERETEFTNGLGSYSELILKFTFKRRLVYSLLQIYAPTILIVILSWFSFWISKNAIPARVALGATTVLTIVTLNGSLRSSVPKVSYVKALDWYLIVSFLFVFGAVLEYVAVLMVVDYHDNGDVNVSQNGNSCGQPKEDGKCPRSKCGADSNGLLRKCDVLLSYNSTPIDKASKILFPVFYALFNLVYWIAYYL